MTRQVTVTITNEIDCTVEGMDPEHMRHFSDAYSPFTANYRFNPKYKLGVWDGKIRFFTSTGKTYVYLLEEILPAVKKLGYKIVINDFRVADAYLQPEHVKADRFAHICDPDSGEPFVFRDYQLRVINNLIDTGCGIGLAATSAGKAQPLTAAIATPTGWQTMGDMALGKEVTAVDGTTCKVTGVYPQGIKPIFRVMFDDGATTECCDEHLWQVQIGGETSVRSLADIRKHMSVKGNDFACVRAGAAVVTGDVVLAEDPYEEGKRVAEFNQCEFPRHLMQQAPRARAHSLRGYLDVVATEADGIIRFEVPHEDMRRSIVEVTRSLGGICYYTPIHESLGYSMEIHHQSPTTIFSAAPVIPRPPVYRHIVAIVPVGDKPAQCISIDHPARLYITDDCIVTHNTFITAGLIDAYEKVGGTSIVIVPSVDLVKQTLRELRMWGLDCGEYSGDIKDLDHPHVVSTWQALQNAPGVVSNRSLILVDECLAADTAISMADGTTKAIVDVVAGDLVMSYNVETSAVEPQRVVKMHENLVKSDSEEMYRLEFDDGSVLEVTGNHEVYTTVGKVRVDQLTDEHDITSLREA